MGHEEGRQQPMIGFSFTFTVVQLRNKQKMNNYNWT
jgi:hypothetical protein